MLFIAVVDVVVVVQGLMKLVFSTLPHMKLGSVFALPALNENTLPLNRRPTTLVPNPLLSFDPRLLRPPSPKDGTIVVDFLPNVNVRCEVGGGVKNEEKS